MVILLLALLWLILSAWIIAAILAAGWPAEPPGPAPDPYAADVAAFRQELHDWDRDGRS
jgi:hypothetical protein